MYATISVLAALAKRDQTGTGDTIDIGMLDVQTAFLANQAMNYLVSGKTPVRNGNKHPNIQPQDVFGVADGHMVVAVGNDRQFEKFCEALELDGIAADPNYSTNAERVNNLDKLHPMISEKLNQKELAYWLDALGSRGVPCGPINTIPMVFEDPQVKHREMLRNIAHPLAGEVAQVVSPMKFEDNPLSFESAPPLLGEHTAQILAELGLQTPQTSSDGNTANE